MFKHRTERNKDWLLDNNISFIDTNISGYINGVLVKNKFGFMTPVNLNINHLKFIERINELV